VKIYLAGPMRGYANFNREAFAHWAGVLRAKGHEVFSPSENSLKLFGAAVRDNAGGDEGQMGGDQLTISRTVFAIDLAWICTQADAVALMPGWDASMGASAEAAAGRAKPSPERLASPEAKLKAFPAASETAIGIELRSSVEHCPCKFPQRA
jgi:hypothetical protein